MSRFLPCFCLLFLVLPAFPGGPRAAAAQTPESERAKVRLAELRGRIAALTTRLGAELKDRDALGARVREAELTITAERLKVETLRAEQSAAERRSAELRLEQARNQSALDAEREALAAQVRAAYAIGPQEQLKLLLNQSDPASAGRMLAFYGYFARARTARIEEINGRVARVSVLAAEAEAQREKLDRLKTETIADMKALAAARDQRLAALAAVDRQVSTGNRELADLKREAEAEEALLADLARVLEDFPVDSQQSFEQLRGRLPWPVPGRMNPGRSGLGRNGVLIDTARGAKVRAPYFGRVVYADWLQGLGLLLIIGHSGDYMTLYGHAEVLYKSVGDWVAPGDVIAALPDAGAGTPQLYFEIRAGRKAVDPKLWLKAAP
jgi:septal ring factor EnvC (AmiA/AmiB activator)